MLRYTIVFVTIFVVSFAISCQKSEKNNKPNIIIVFTDDQGYQDVGCYDAQGFDTPNLDKMAAEGMRFNSFYSASPVCSPSRAALLTGTYPPRVGISVVLYPISSFGLNPDEITLAEILKEQGYATACVGKWHLGDYPAMMPLKQGFDEYFGLPYSNDMWPWQGDYKRKHRTALYSDLPLYLNDTVIEKNPDQNQLTKRYTEYAVNFIEKNKDKSFFLYLPHTMPHIPLGVSQKFSGKTAYGRYGDVIEEIDWSVGKILKTLKENKLDKNTLVVFTSDNGPWLTAGKSGGKAGPFREGKGTTFEGGVRMPCIMRWPGKIPEGKINNEITCTMDLLPTIARLAGSSAPQDRVIDGRDIWPLMSGDTDAESPHKTFFYHRKGKLQAVRSGDWKLHFPHKYNHVFDIPGTNGNQVKEVESFIELSLYNLREDPGETKNLVDKYPEIVDKLTAIAKTHLQDLAENSRKPFFVTDKNWKPYKDRLAQGKYISDWWIIGNFDNTERQGMDSVYKPEIEFKPNKSYKGRNKKIARWQQYDGKDNEYINLAKMFSPSDEGVAYARRIFTENNNTVKK